MRNKRSASFGRKILIGASAAAMMAPAAGALAQDEAVDEIVVTVERREQSLQDYAGTAAQISGEDLKALGIANMADLDGAIPGLNITNNQGNIEVWIRGVGNSNNTELGDPAAATHMNGVYIPRPAGFGSAFFDIERVEVNFGPQGTLRGRNAMAGSVDAVAFKPGLGQTDGSIEVTLGQDNTEATEGVINLPLSDNSAARFAFYAKDRDSFYTNVSPDVASLNANPSNATNQALTADRYLDDMPESIDSQAVRLSYYAEPADNLDVTFVFDNIDEEGAGYTGTGYNNPIAQGVDPDDVPDGRSVFARLTPESTEAVEHWGAKLEVNYETDWFDIQFISSHRDMERDFVGYAPLAPDFAVPGGGEVITDYDNYGSLVPYYDNLGSYTFATLSESKVNEVRFISNDDSVPYTWTAGLFHFNEEIDNFFGTLTDNRENWEWALNTTEETLTFTENESYAAYVDGTYDLSDRLRLTAGLRYTEDEKSRTGFAVKFKHDLRQYYEETWGDNLYQHNGNLWRLGSEGFAWNKWGRSMATPDADGDGVITSDENIAFFLDGIDSFGDSDTLGHTLSSGRLDGNWWVDNSAAIAAAAAGEQPGLCTDRQDSWSQTTGFSNCLAPTATIPYKHHGQVTMRQPAYAAQNGLVEDDYMDWRVRVEYDMADDWMTYALVSTGHKSGGFNDNIPLLVGEYYCWGGNAGAEPWFAALDNSGCAAAGQSNTYEWISVAEFDDTGVAPTYDREEVVYFELGSKQEFEYADMDVKLNASAFYYDYSDMAISSVRTLRNILETSNLPTTGYTDAGLGAMYTFTTNVEEATIMGLQIETGAQLRNGLNVNLDAIFMDTELNPGEDMPDSRFSTGIDRDIDGNELARAPKTQLKLDVSQAINTQVGQFDWIVSAGYRSSYYSTIFNNDDFGDASQTLRLSGEMGDYTTIDLGLGFTPASADNLRVEGYISNLTDEHEAVVALITGTDHTRFFNGPRTAGVRVRAKF